MATAVLAVGGVWAALLALGGLKRRRAEVSSDALRRFIAVQAVSHPTMLAAARKVTAEREAAAGGQPFERCSIQELLARQHPPEDAIDALQRCLDALEEIAVGCRLGIYDPYVIYHGAATKVREYYDFGRPHVKRTREGQVDHRERQSTAYEHIEWFVDVRLAAIEKEGAPTRLAGALSGS